MNAVHNEWPNHAYIWCSWHSHAYVRCSIHIHASIRSSVNIRAYIRCSVTFYAYVRCSVRTQAYTRCSENIHVYSSCSVNLYAWNSPACTERSLLLWSQAKGGLDCLGWKVCSLPSAERGFNCLDCWDCVRLPAGIRSPTEDHQAQVSFFPPPPSTGLEQVPAWPVRVRSRWWRNCFLPAPPAVLPKCLPAGG